MEPLIPGPRINENRSISQTHLLVSNQVRASVGLKLFLEPSRWTLLQLDCTCQLLLVTSMREDIQEGLTWGL